MKAGGRTNFNNRIRYTDIGKESQIIMIECENYFYKISLYLEMRDFLFESRSVGRFISPRLCAGFGCFSIFSLSWPFLCCEMLQLKTLQLCYDQGCFSLARDPHIYRHTNTQPHTLHKQRMHQNGKDFFFGLCHNNIFGAQDSQY